MDPVMIRPPGIDNGAFVVSPESVWYARVLLLFSASVMTQAVQHGGFDALDYRKIRQGNAGKLGTYDILSVLPDKFARFLIEFPAHRFESLVLPFLPTDRSDFDVHGALLDDKVHEYVMLCTMICHTLNAARYFWFHKLL
jgi:hypothetical protein